MVAPSMQTRALATLLWWRSAEVPQSARRSRSKQDDTGTIWARALGFVALTFASVNIFGGFLVTQRMLAMYQKKKK